ncbi:hypothetical protein F5B19DRAFT_300026 [Rostrohypoxylon terebratum]|nr:hypothetical protein F5B19DRAFT_300026 [Rostrohypoxylon terebratum]
MADDKYQSSSRQLQSADTGSIHGEREESDDILSNFHPDLISFITLCQYHKVDFWPISWDLTLDKLGRGATGDVRQFLVDLKSQFAFKIFSTSRIPQGHRLPENVSTFFFADDEKLFKNLISEIIILSQPQVQQHAHIVNVEGVCFDVETFKRGPITSDVPDSGIDKREEIYQVCPVLVMKKAQHGSLDTYVDSIDPVQLDITQKLRLCAQIGSAIHTMHSNDIVHGDIKPQNVLIYTEDDHTIAKLTDFSYSCFGKTENGIVRLPISAPYQAPEFHHRGFKIKNAKKMDIYSFGMVCFWLLFREAFERLTREKYDLNRLEIRKSAAELSLEVDQLTQSHRQSLESLFLHTLCETPEERECDWEKLVGFLGQRLWQPTVQRAFFDGTRRMTLADFNATEDDINDSEKLRALTQKILDCVHLTGSDYDLMKDHLDPAIIARRKDPVKFIHLVLEGLSKFAVPSPERDNEMEKELIHNSFNVASAFYQLSMLDYRVRIQIAKSLESRATEKPGGCKDCVIPAAFEVSFCYKLGFGVDPDASKVEKWISTSRSQIDKLDQRLSHLRDTTISDIQLSRHSTVGSSGMFLVNLSARYKGGGLDSASEHLDREVRNLERTLGTGHWLVFELKIELIHLITGQKKIDAAMVKSKELIASTQALYGPEHPLCVRAKLSLANLYQMENRWEEAELLLSQARTILFEHQGPRHQLAIQTSLSLASLYADRGKLVDAEKEFKQLLETLKGTLHISQPAMQSSVNIYAKFLERQGRSEEANDLHRKYMEDFDKEQNEEETVTKLMNEHNECWYAWRNGDSAKAMVVLPGVIRKAETKEFKRVAMMARRHLALVYRDQNYFQEAEVQQRRLREDIAGKFGECDRDTLSVTYDLARTLQMQEKWDEAERLQLSVKRGRSRLLGRTHEETILASQRLAEIYTAQDRLLDAMNEKELIVTACQERLGLHNSDTFSEMKDLGVLYIQLYQWEKAGEVFRNSLEVAEVLLDRYDAEALGLRSNLGLVYLRAGRFSEAEELLRPTLVDMMQHLGPQHEYTKITAGHLFEAYMRNRR